MERYNYQREREISHSSNPSFSSTLLDAIYRSIDQGEDEQLVVCKETMRKKQSNNMDSYQRASMIEKWMENKASDKAIVRRKSAADFERKNLNSSSSSSDSSNSEAESVYGVSSGSSCYGLNKPKPIRTSVSTHKEKFNKHSVTHVNDYGDFSHNRSRVERDFSTKMKNEGGFVKTKSKALKIYGDLKKSKQPISPGGRLASFLNSIFTNAKKAKVSSNSANTSTCSSASSFSRSCLSKNTPKSSNGTKRSVRFYPVSVIVDEDCQPCGHKNLFEEQANIESVKNIRKTINEELKFHAMEKNRRVDEAAKDLLRNYQKKVEREFDFHSQIKKMEVSDDDEDDDVASCASSDLFELDNLSTIGIDRYREELPVYETTHFGTNQAIANGLIL